MKMFKGLLLSLMSLLMFACSTQAMENSPKTTKREREESTQEQSTRALRRGRPESSSSDFSTSAVTNLASILSQSTSSNDLTTKIATTWVRNASEYIFHDDLRSFLELVVNACDVTVETAGRPNDVVGKFGMGFYSIFSLLNHQETAGAKIILKTAYRNQTNNLEGYTLTFTKLPGHDINIDYNPMTTRPTKTGTVLEIRPNEYAFSDATIKKLRQYTHYLDFYPHVRTNLMVTTSEGTVTEQIGGASSQNNINVILKPNCLSVEDFGKGISTECAFDTLLIPSSSSKRRSDLNDLRFFALEQEPQLPQLVQWQGKDNPAESHFIITVNGVMVLDKTLAQPIKDAGMVYDLVLPMPQATQLTLARNELAITPDGFSFEEAMLKKIIATTIDETLRSSGSKMVLAALYHGLQQWESQTAASHIRGVFTGHFKKILNHLLETKNIVALPERYASYLAPIVTCFTSQSFNLIPLPEELVNYNFHALETIFEQIARASAASSPNKNLLEQGLDGKIISGKQVIFVSGKLLPQTPTGSTKVTNLSLKSLLFVPIEILEARVATPPSERERRSTQELLASDIASRYSQQPITSPQHAKPKTKFIVRTDAPQNATPLPPLPQGMCDNDIHFTSREIKAKERPGSDRIVQAKHLRYLPAPTTSFSAITKFLYDQIDTANPLKVECEKIKLDGEILDGQEIFLNGLNFLVGAVWMTGGGSLFFDVDNKDRFARLLDNLLLLHGITNHDQVQYPLRLLNAYKDKLGLFAYIDSPLKMMLIKENPALIAEVTESNYRDSMLCNRIYDFIVQRLHHDKYCSGALFAIDNDDITPLWPLPAQITPQAIDKLATCLIHNCYGVSIKDDDSSRRDAELFNGTIENYIKTLPEEMQTSLLSLSSVNGDETQQLHETINSSLLHPGPLPCKYTAPLVTIPNVNEETLKPIASAIKKAMPYIENYTAHLASKFSGISVEACTLPLTILATYAKEQHSMDVYDRLEKLINTLLGLYDHYYHLEEKDLAFVYGERQLYNALCATQETTPESLYQTAALIAGTDTQLFEKLIAFTIDDHVFQTSLQQRAHDLDKKQLYQPSLFSNTPLSLLTIISERLSPTIAQTCLATARSAEEIIMVAYMLLNPVILPLLKAISPLQEQRVIASVEYLISCYIREKLDKEKIVSLMTELRPQKNIEDRIDHIAQQPFMRAIVEYFQSITSEQSSFKNQADFITTMASTHHHLDCNLSQLLKTHCTGIGIIAQLEAGDLATVAQQVSTHQSGFGCDKIMQAIEAGSERSSVEATIIECVQNSIDAIKQFGRAQDTELKKRAFAHRMSNVQISQQQHIHSLANIDISLGFVPGATDTTQSHLFLSITDHIGMPSLKTLLTDLVIPDYSAKSPAHGSVGVMGNGTFQMYQAATKVFILTRLVNNPDQVYCLEITPQRNAQGQVYDLGLCCNNVSHEPYAQNFYGTSINVMFKPEDHEKKNVFNYLAAKNFLRNAAGAVHTEINPETQQLIQINYVPEVIFDGVLRANTQVELLNPSPTATDMLYAYPAQAEKPLISVYRRTNDLLQSYVLTGGIPFLPLTQLVKEMHLLPPAFIESMATGIIIDIAPSMYHPVQSRTHLKMDDAGIQRVRQALLDAFYQYVLYQGTRDSTILNRCFTHFESRCSDLPQVQLSASTSAECQQTVAAFIRSGMPLKGLYQESFFTNYQPSTIRQSQELKSFYDHIAMSMPYFTYELGTVNIETMTKFNALIEQAKQQLSDGVNPSDIRTQLMKLIDTLMETAQGQANNIRLTWQQKKLAENTMPEELVKHVVIPWFAKKIEHWANGTFGGIFSISNILMLLPELMTEEEKKTNKNGQELYDQLVLIKTELHHVLNKFLECYCMSFKQFSSQPIYLKTTGWIVDIPCLKGYYQPYSENININIAACPIGDLFDLIKAIYWNNLEGLQRNHVYNLLFGTLPGAVGTVVHELEHARRKSDDSVHGPATDADGNEDVSFNACAVSFAHKFIEAGLIEKWSESFRQSTSYDIVQKVDYETIKKIKKLEKINDTLLLKLFK